VQTSTAARTLTYYEHRAEEFRAGTLGTWRWRNLAIGGALEVGQTDLWKVQPLRPTYPPLTSQDVRVSIREKIVVELRSHIFGRVIGKRGGV
jgi:hypothetical protein